MTALAPFVHFALVLADQLDRTTDEMPAGPCEPQRLMLTGLARALQLTAEQLKAEEAERERRMREGVNA